MVSIGSRQTTKKWAISASRLVFTFVGIMILLIVASLWMFAATTNTTTKDNQQQQQQHSRKAIQQQFDNNDIRVEPEELGHEKRFRDTINKSCLPKENPKCQQFVPDWIAAERHKVQRVALISPPGEISSTLAHRIDEIIQKHNQRVDKFEIELIQTSHVPPYGYGKTHGLTRILRLIPQPLILEVTDALHAVVSLENGSGIHDITLEDLKMALRQIMRLHCRLSHVAAHTALLSITFVELQHDPGLTIERIRSFLAPQELREGLHNTTLYENQILLRSEMTYATEILSSVQQRNPEINVLQELDHVLVEEMKISKDMTIWPCLSFWDTGNDKQPLSSITKKIAQALSPDCDDHYNTCFVERDKCEFHGDAVCKR